MILLICINVIQHYGIPSDLSRNKHVRTKGIDALLILCKEKFHETDETFMKRKINNLRIVFRRELNKVRQSKGTGPVR